MAMHCDGLAMLPQADNGIDDIRPMRRPHHLWR
jgi:hypothetical protein